MKNQFQLVPFSIFTKIPPFIAFCFIIIFVFLLFAISSPLISPFDPIEPHMHDRLSPPFTISESGRCYFLGTDNLGRDIFSRIIYGARVSISVGFLSVLLSGSVGAFLGLISGLYGGKIDDFVMGIVDIQFCFPHILLAIGIIAALGTSFTNLIIVLSISGWVYFARLTRGEVLRLKEIDYLEAVRALGGSNMRIIFSHLLPNVMSSIIVCATLELARVIILESSLSFLGLGVEPPTPSWGVMLSDGRMYLVTAWWLATFPGIAILLLTMSCNRIGDWYRDIADPRLKHVRR